MVKMKNKSTLQVTFSKRRSGLFKKASEVCTLCSAEMALVVFSLRRKVFSFGHPSVEAAVDHHANCQRFIPTDQMVSTAGVSGAENGTMLLLGKPGGYSRHGAAKGTEEIPGGAQESGSAAGRPDHDASLRRRQRCLVRHRLHPGSSSSATAVDTTVLSCGWWLWIWTTRSWREYDGGAL